MSVNNTLGERGKKYGKFSEHSMLSQDLQNVMSTHRPDGQHAFAEMMPIQKEALIMIQHKIARIINGDPNYVDNWHDIQGYAKLVEDYLNEQMGH